MSRVIRIPDELFHRLQKLATPFEDTPATVIERLLDFYSAQEASTPKFTHEPALSPVVRSYNLMEHCNTPDDSALSNRTPRQRGAITEIDGNRFDASSLADLYEQVLIFLEKTHRLELLRSHMPIRTSNKRYLLAFKPVHPNGKEFVRPVEYRGYYMESHKDYKVGVGHLRKMLNLAGTSITYIS